MPTGTSSSARRAPVRVAARTGVAWTLAATAAVLALVGGGGIATGGFTGVTRGTGTFQSGTHLASDVIGATTCLSSPNAAAAISTNSATCTAAAATAPAATGTVTFGSQGSITPTAATLTNGTCGIQSFNDTSTAATQPGLTVGGVTYRAAGPTSLSGSVSAAFDGSTGNLMTPKVINGPMAFSISAWFRTGTVSSAILGFAGPQAATATSTHDRLLYLDGSGRLVFGVWPGFNFTVSSAATTTKNYADSAWHHVVVTLGPASPTSASLRMYADGALVAGSVGNETGVSGTSPAETATGYWHLGWENLAGWAGGNNFFTGSLADVAIFPTELTAANVTTLATATTQAAEASAIATLNPTTSWLLQDQPSTTYTGAIDGVPANPVKYFRDASGNPGTDVGTGQGTFTPGAAGPPTGGSSTTFDGSSGYGSTATAIAGPYTFSLALWFKSTLPAVASSIVGFANNQGTSVSNWDRSLWLDTSGHLVFGVNPGSLFTVNSSATTSANFADGAWHFVVVTVAPLSATTGTLKLYADGALVAGSVANIPSMSGSRTAQNYTGYWHLGWGSTAGGWPTQTTSYFLKGSLADVAVFGTELTAVQVGQLFGQTSRSTYAGAVTGGVATATQFWPLDDSATTSSPACGYLSFTMGTASMCAVPAQTKPCPNPSGVPAAGSSALAVPLPALTVTTQRIGTLPTTASGLHVIVPWRVTTTGGGFTATLDHDRGFVTL